MHVNDFDYELPPGLIAKEPLAQRDGCRLLHVKRGTGGGSDGDLRPYNHLIFKDILGLVRAGDRLVFNDTKVIPARVFCRKDATGAAVELFFTERVNDNSWKALVKPAKRAPAGTVLSVDGHPDVKIRVDGVLADGYERTVSLLPPGQSSEGPLGLDDGLTGGLGAVIDRYGHIPLPHYIEREDAEADRETYQTVYAATPGAVAAPTAGLHFTDGLLDDLTALGVDKTFLTLHVGIGTFRPVQADDPRQHDIHEERFELTERAADEINDTWGRGGRVIAVGTTVVRTLESCAVSHHKVAPKSSRTKLMILPPYDFKAVDGLITNFHLPKSTLLMLVSAFSSRETILGAYQEAIAQKYRFYSYGDAMIII
ncbi:MAG: tRNA preQ1(34) S-adenosylmethionine ribosyltransferase-isomerase QueA [Chitinispirillia bacterium]|nr:tRNA preQ1(34) S-adenosylmethionine ribosyltransferase-isomerase QueA [Chitinispirillia bacterium]MCL2242764.1 tRNA preQ1(34) S-adenosylmethionine ribosyltransferase-isomerase QueA [Chitinispirillia bacterium]